MEEIAQIIGVDSLGYLSLEDVKLLCGEGCRDGFCTACFDEDYPTPVPKDTRKNRFELKISERLKEKDE